MKKLEEAAHSREEELKSVWEVQDPFMFLEETQGVMGTDICAKEPTRDSDRRSMAKGDINTLGRDNCANNSGQRRSWFMSTAAAWERLLEH